MIRHSRFLPVLGALLVLTACDSATESVVQPLGRVEVIPAQMANFAPSLVLTGEVQARSTLSLSFNASGRVTQRLVEVGEHVERGQVLARIDPTQQQAALAVAEASLAVAKAQLDQERNNHDRQQALFESGNATRASLESAVQALRISEAAVASAEAQFDVARERLYDTDLVAPAPGLIISGNAETDQIVQVAQVLFVLAEDGPRDAVFEVQEAPLLTIPESIEIALEVMSNSHETLTGTLREMSPTLDPYTGAVRVRVGINEDASHIPLGAIIVGRASAPATQAMIVPTGALTVANGRPAVWLVEPETSRLAVQPVTIVAYQKGSAVISGGLAPGSQVVVRGPRAMRVGQQVALSGDQP